MEAQADPSQPSRDLPGEKAERIIEAMRQSVARRGVAGSTFDHVAREAGVSRGLLHYYFGTKERLLVEVVRREADLRFDALDAQLAEAQDADAFLHLLQSSVDEMLRTDPTYVTLTFELFTLATRNEEVAEGYRDLMQRTRKHLADSLRAKEQEGVLHLTADPESVADVLFSMGDGLTMRVLAEPDRDFGPAIAAAIRSLRGLLDDA